MIERHYKTAELAELLSLNPETIRRAVAAGNLEAVRPTGSDLRFTESAVKRWLDAGRVPARVVNLARRRQTGSSTNRARRAG